MLGSACSNSTSGSTSSGGGAGGANSGSIVVGALATESGPLAAGFGEVVDGAKAYFDYVNAHGGVAGRKIELKYVADDTGSPTNDTTQARNLVEEDGVFAVVGVGTPFFSGASFLTAEGVPAFGYVVSTNWNDSQNLFGAYGSYLDYATDAYTPVYVARKLDVKSVGLVSYNIAAASEDVCAAIAGSLKNAGINVNFEDLAFPLGGDPTADVLQMKSKGVGLFVTCMEGSDNLAFAEAMHQNGMTGVHALWLTGYDRALVKQNSAVMQGVIYELQHVPFEAAAAFPGKYPGMQQYLSVMNQYEPHWTYDETAIQGYINAEQFVQGLKDLARAKEPLTRQNLIDVINKDTEFSGNGLTTSVNWTYAHTSAPPPYCAAYVEVGPGGSITPVFVQPHDQVFVCENNQNQLVPPLRGSP